MAQPTATRPREARSARGRQVNAGGMLIEPFIPGGFYQGVFPGHFSDSVTGFVIPGPKANLDKKTGRSVESLLDIPEPVQLPHAKIVVEISDSGKTRKEIEVPFDSSDENPVHDIFVQALGTGLIRYVSDEEMQEKYPETWANRETHMVWHHPDTKPKKSMREMLEEASDDDRLLRLNDAVIEDARAREQQISPPLEEIVPERIEVLSEKVDEQPSKPPVPPKPKR